MWWPYLRESVSIEEKKVKVRTSQGSATTAIEVQVERWSYIPGEGKLLKTLNFRDGILAEIETGNRLEAYSVHK